MEPIKVKIEIEAEIVGKDMKMQITCDNNTIKAVQMYNILEQSIESIAEAMRIHLDKYYSKSNKKEHQIIASSLTLKDLADGTDKN